MTLFYTSCWQKNGARLLRKRDPEVTVLDPPEAIRLVHNRQSMLQDVADLNLSDNHGRIGLRRQLVITKDPFSIPG